MIFVCFRRGQSYGHVFRVSIPARHQLWLHSLSVVACPVGSCIANASRACKGPTGETVRGSTMPLHAVLLCHPTSEALVLIPPIASLNPVPCQELVEFSAYHGHSVPFACRQPFRVRTFTWLFMRQHRELVRFLFIVTVVSCSNHQSCKQSHPLKVASLVSSVYNWSEVLAWDILASRLRTLKLSHRP